MNTVTLDIAKIRTDGSTQPRAKISDDAVVEYADDLKSGDVFPPVDVFHDGEAYWLADGFHRVEAHGKAGKKTVRANIHQGTQRDAILFAVGANKDHGQRRTNADKRQAVTRLLKDEEWGKWSDREIARRCAVSDRFVNELRKGASANRSQMRKVSRGGKTYSQNTASIGASNGNGDVAPKSTANDEPAPKAPEPEPPQDCRGTKIEKTKVAKAFACAALFAEAEGLHRQLLRKVDEIANSDGGAYLDLDEFKGRAKEAKDCWLLCARPYVICPLCSGDGCKACRKTGYLPKFHFDSVVPEELKT